MDFEELLALLQSPPEDGLPETVYDDITGLYNGAVERGDGADARIAQFEQQLAEKEAEITALKARNYELLEQVGSTPAEPETSPEDVLPDESEGIESLFDDTEDEE